MVRNIYESKNYKLFALVPIAMLLIALYFIPHIPLDSTLRGGVQVQLETNQSINSQQLTAQVDAAIPQAEASVSASPGGVSVTIATNSSLATAQQQLLGIYNTYANYSAAEAAIANYQHQLSVQQNATAQAALSSELANATAAMTQLDAQTSAIIATLHPLLLPGQQPSYNTSDAQGMVNAAQGAYTNATAQYKSFVISKLGSIVSFSSYSYSEITPTLGAYFLQQMQWIVISAFILVGISVFMIFRTPIPSLAVVFGAGNDILVALGAMGLFGIPLGVASIGGLLMLIGYSIDTDMLSAIRILKRGEGTATERAFATMKTGMTMTFAAIITFSILLVVSYVTFIPTYFEIASVVLIGLITDLATTWLGNTSMVLWYKKRKEVG